MSVCRKVKPDGSVLNLAETHPQGSRQAFKWTEVVTELSQKLSNTDPSGSTLQQTLVGHVHPS